MSTEFEKKRISFSAPAAENTFSAEPSSAWTPAQYEPWNYGGRSGPAAPSGSENNSQQQQQGEQSTSLAAPGAQPWLGYYPSQHLQHSHQPQQQGGQAPTNQGLPPLPSVPPPQPPPPPEPSTSLSSWSAVVAGGSETRVADAAGSSYPNFYNHQQQHVQESNYGGQDGQGNTGSGSNNASAPPSNVTANGSHNYGQSYAGYNAATSGDQYALGSGNYSGHNYGYPQQQGNDSYSQNMGPPYQNSGAAPYPPVNSFSSTSSYTDSTSYQTTGTYYNAGVYQNTGGYPSSGYSGHPNSWSDNNYGNYGGYPGYTGYAAPNQSNSAGPGAVSNASHYQQDYQPQWAEYYSNAQNNPPANSEAAPGTTPTSTPPPTYASVVAQGPGGMLHPVVSNQPPPPGTQPSWQPGAPLFATASQASTPTSKAGSWDASTMQSSQTDPHSNMMQSHFQGGLPQLANIGKAQTQLHTPTIFQLGVIPQSPQVPVIKTQKTQLDTPSSLAFKTQGPPQMKTIPQWRAGKIQIPNNPRIVSNFIGKGKSNLEPAQKPAYISVGAKAGKLSSDDITDAALQPGMFPSSLRAYVERALSRCKDEAQKSACQDIMKEMITAASRDKSLFIKDWDTEPLFPLPNIPSTSSAKGPLRHTNAGDLAIKSENTPNKRVRSRWEPVGEDDMDDRHGHNSRDPSKDSVRDRVKERDISSSPPKWEKRDGNWNRTKSAQQHNSEHASLGKKFRRGTKRGRRSLGLTFNGAASSSESEEDAEASVPGVAGVILGSLVSGETPEEKKRRQSRTKRFDRGKEAGAKAGGKVKAGVGGTASARRATALQLAMSYGDGNGHAVEDIDWDSLTVRGTCQEIEKKYLRLTSAPDPSTVRPEEILRKALAMVQSTPKNYLFRCEQLKSIRQDLTVQRIRDELTVQVYETHARMALESGDLPEYNQCQTQLKGLYAEDIKGCSNEFAGYSLLYIIFNHGNSRDLLSTMARLSKEARKDEAVKHALAVRAAVSLGNYAAFFKLYRTAPNLSPYLMDKHVEKMRFEAVKCMVRSYRPLLPVVFVARTLGFSGILTSEGGEEKEIDGVEECEEWLKTHGAFINFDDSASELVIDAKASANSLFMPEPEDIIPHGDANLALNDFFSARS